MRFPFLGLGLSLLLVACSTNRKAVTDAERPDAVSDLPGSADTQPWGAEGAVETGPGAKDAVTADGSAAAEVNTQDGPSATDVLDAAANVDTVPVDAKTGDARGGDSVSIGIDAIVPRTGSASATLSFSLVDGGSSNANTAVFTTTNGQVIEGHTGGFPAFQISLVMGQRAFSVTLRGDLTPGTVYTFASDAVEDTAILDYIENQKRGWSSPYLLNPRVGTIEVLAATSTRVDLAVRSVSLYGGANGATGTVVVDGTIVLTW